jgi:hypothetical protein
VTGDQEPSRVAGALSRGIDDAAEAYRRRLAELIVRHSSAADCSAPEQTPEM